jgi:hypothetical protein
VGVFGPVKNPKRSNQQNILICCHIYVQILQQILSLFSGHISKTVGGNLCTYLCWILISCVFGVLPLGGFKDLRLDLHATEPRAKKPHGDRIRWGGSLLVLHATEPLQQTPMFYIPIIGTFERFSGTLLALLMATIGSSIRRALYLQR